MRSETAGCMSVVNQPRNFSLASWTEQCYIADLDLLMLFSGGSNVVLTVEADADDDTRTVPHLSMLSCVLVCIPSRALVGMGREVTCCEVQV